MSRLNPSLSSGRYYILHLPKADGCKTAAQRSKDLLIVDFGLAIYALLIFDAAQTLPRD
jgi:hypothetical protein